MKANKTFSDLLDQFHKEDIAVAIAIVPATLFIIYCVLYVYVEFWDLYRYFFYVRWVEETFDIFCFILLIKYLRRRYAQTKKQRKDKSMHSL